MENTVINNSEIFYGLQNLYKHFIMSHNSICLDYQLRFYDKHPKNLTMTLLENLAYGRIDENLELTDWGKSTDFLNTFDKLINISVTKNQIEFVYENKTIKIIE